MAACLGVFALGLLTAGCAAPVDGSDGDEHAGSAEQAQLDPSDRSYTITQANSTVGSAWAGKTKSGETVEYWVANASYAESDARGITSDPQTCAEWKRTVCGDSWSGAQRYRAVYTQTTLDCTLPPGPCAPGLECTLPPGPCTPSADARSFLGDGSYEVQGASEQTFAWTYVSGSCEYWAMRHQVSAVASKQVAPTTSWTSLDEFQKSVCEGNSGSLIWYSVYYEPISCDSITC
ncbi:MAG: hypothetical protein QM820_64470 [Minicystis sp.]